MVAGGSRNRAASGCEFASVGLSSRGMVLTHELTDSRQPAKTKSKNQININSKSKHQTTTNLSPCRINTKSKHQPLPWRLATCVLVVALACLLACFSSRCLECTVSPAPIFRNAVIE